MNAITPKMLDLIRLAAERRVAGSTWEAVARDLRRQVHTIRRWPVRYREEWSRALAEARRASIEAAADEARAILRRYLRHDDARISRDAARLLIQHPAARSSEPTSPAPTGIDPLFEGMSDEQIRKLLGDEEPERTRTSPAEGLSGSL
jgi:hypothetical protein